MSELGLSCTIKEIGEVNAILETVDGVIFDLPKKLFNSVSVGEKITLYSLPERTNTPAHETIARELLNQLLANN